MSSEKYVGMDVHQATISHADLGAPVFGNFLFPHPHGLIRLVVMPLREAEWGVF
jgi:hypothetical protein